KQTDGSACANGFGFSCFGVCLVPAGASSGRCCHAACNLGDPTCGASACDTSGACVYPDAGLDCGSPTCAGGVLTTHACDGLGTCATTSEPCPGSQPCSSASSC